MNGILGKFRQDRGAAAMEFALVFPVLMTLLAAIVDFGKVVFVENAVRAIIDEAARNAVVRDMTESAVTDSVSQSVADLPELASVDVDASVAPCEVTVTVTGTFNLFLTGLLPDQLADGIGFTLTSRYPKC